MQRSQTTHALWVLLITILLGAPNIGASTPTNMVGESSEIDTASGIVSKSSSVNALSVVVIPFEEQEKITEITRSLAQPKYATDDKKAEYIYHELATAARSKHLHVIDCLISLNFERDQYLLFNSSLAHIVGIPAARGDEDLAIIERILNAKQAAFVRFGRRDESQHKIEMTEIANRIIAFSSSNYKLVQRILANTDLICFDVEGVNWALMNIMRAPYSREKCGILRLLYENAHVKPDLEGTIDALEIAFEANNDQDLSTVLMLDITRNHRGINDILKETMLNVRAHIVRKIINGKKDTRKASDILVLNENSKILALIKFRVDSSNALNQADKEKADAIALEIRAEMLNYTMPFLNVACCELVNAVYKLHVKTNKMTLSEDLRYRINKDCFKENVFPLLSLKIGVHGLKIGGEHGLKLHPDVYRKLTELWNELLIQSFTCSDYEMGMDLLDAKYQIDFDRQTIKSVIDSIEDKRATKKRKVKIENTAEEVVPLSLEDQFLRLLRSRMS
jgi:hypothetical protein